MQVNVLYLYSYIILYSSYYYYEYYSFILLYSIHIHVESYCILLLI